MEIAVKNRVNGVLTYNTVNKWEIYENVCLLLSEAQRINVNVHSVDTFLNNENQNIIYSLASRVQSVEAFCEDVIERLNLMSKVTWPNRNLAKVLITELVNKLLLWGIDFKNCFVKCILKHKKQIMKLYQEKMDLQNTDRLYCCMVNTLVSSHTEVVSYLKNNNFKLVSTPPTYQEFLSKASTIEKNEFIVDFHFSELFVFKVNPFNELKCDIGKIKRSLLNEVFLVSLKASLAVTKILDPLRNSTIVDLCACPGTKTFCLAAEIMNEGKIFAVDLHEKKITLLKSFLKSTGVTCVESFREGVLNTKMSFKEDLVDYVVLDAPCSQPVSKLIEQKNYCFNNAEEVSKRHNLFVRMLHTAFNKYVNVKKIIYTTCSTNVEENEAVVEAVLPYVEPFGFDLVNCHTLLPGFSAGSPLFPVGHKCLYLKAERDMTDCFIALFVKETFEPINHKIISKRLINSTESGVDTQMSDKTKLMDIQVEEPSNTVERVCVNEKDIDQCIKFSIKKRGKKNKEVKSTPLKSKSKKAMKNFIRRKIIGIKILKK